MAVDRPSASAVLAGRPLPAAVPWSWSAF